MLEKFDKITLAAIHHINIYTSQVDIFHAYDFVRWGTAKNNLINYIHRNESIIFYLNKPLPTF